MSQVLATVALAKWYAAHCNGEWEHSFGIKIDTIDNPGWMVKIDLAGTELESRELAKLQIDRSEADWVQCFTRDRVFVGAGDPSKLDYLLGVFLDFAGSR